LGISKDVSPGYSEIRINFKIDSDAQAEQLKGLIEFAPSFLPTYCTILETRLLKWGLKANKGN
jgi:hypothetical protein